MDRENSEQPQREPKAVRYYPIHPFGRYGKGRFITLYRWSPETLSDGGKEFLRRHGLASEDPLTQKNKKELAETYGVARIYDDIFILDYEKLEAKLRMYLREKKLPETELAILEWEAIGSILYQMNQQR